MRPRRGTKPRQIAADAISLAPAALATGWSYAAGLRAWTPEAAGRAAASEHARRAAERRPRRERLEAAASAGTMP